MLLLPADEAADLATLPEIFANASIEPEPLRGAFGVCYVAFAGTHEKRYRGERILEAAASQLRAAAAAHGTGVIDQCVFTDQPERPRPYVQLSLPLRTPLDGAPFVSLCGEYTRRFNRPCKLLFGYMAKAIAAARAPYTATVFVDTDTFVCDVAPLLVLRGAVALQVRCAGSHATHHAGLDQLGRPGRAARGSLRLGHAVAARVHKPRRLWRPASPPQGASGDEPGDEWWRDLQARRHQRKR